ncbi:MAG TPA: glycosyltransferase family 2 protein [Propionibacteriaceae bacterium]|nr:glycosyltransferase family 2 protein [Propionibacteriaceae bacterium]
MASASPTADIAVVVCTYQMARWSQLMACLESLQQQTLRPSQVVVVVDGCDDVARALHERGGPELVVALEENQGLSAARNAGAAKTVTRWIAFLDDDAVAEPRWLELLYQACLDLSAAGAGGWSQPDFDGEMPAWLPHELLWTVGCSHRGLPTSRTLVRNMFGGCALLDADVFRRVGGFDAEMGRVGNNASGGEEADYCRRVAALDSSARFAHVPDAVIRHRVGLERMSRAYLIRRCYQEGKAKARLAGAGRQALAPERDFVTKVAPRGIQLSLKERQPQRAMMLVAGVHAAALAYVVVRGKDLAVGRGRARANRRREPAEAGAMMSR